MAKLTDDQKRTKGFNKSQKLEGFVTLLDLLNSLKDSGDMDLLSIPVCIDRGHGCMSPVTEMDSLVLKDCSKGDLQGCLILMLK